MEPGLHLSKDMAPSTPEEVELMRTIPYIHAVGSLMYLAISTRPDIAYTVGVLSRFSPNPGPPHWLAVKHLFRYLKGTLDYKLTYSPTSCSAPHQSELFLTYSDAAHKGDSDNKYSTGAYAVKMGTGAISWSSKLQTVVAKSTTEAEYHAVCAAGSELMFLRNLFTEFGYSFNLLVVT